MNKARAPPTGENLDKIMFSGEIASLELKSMGGYRLLVNETGIHPQASFQIGAISRIG